MKPLELLDPSDQRSSSILQGSRFLFQRATKEGFVTIASSRFEMFPTLLYILWSYNMRYPGTRSYLANEVIIMQ